MQTRAWNPLKMAPKTSQPHIVPIGQKSYDVLSKHSPPAPARVNGPPAPSLVHMRDRWRLLLLSASGDLSLGVPNVLLIMGLLLSLSLLFSSSSLSLSSLRVPYFLPSIGYLPCFQCQGQRAPPSPDRLWLWCQFWRKEVEGKERESAH